MNSLAGLAGKPIAVDTALEQLTKFVQDYEPAGRLSPITSLKDAELVTTISNSAMVYLTEVLNLAVNTETYNIDLTKLTIEQTKLAYLCVTVLKMFTRISQSSMFAAACDEAGLTTLLSLIYAATLSFNAYIITDKQSDDEEIAKYAYLLLYRLEATRLVQNITILTLSQVENTIVKSKQYVATQDVPILIFLLNKIFETLYVANNNTIKASNNNTINIKYNQVVIQKLLTTYKQIQLQTLLGLTEMQHITRVLSVLFSHQQNARAFAKFGTIAVAYKTFDALLHTPVSDAANQNGKFIAPELFNANVAILGFTDDLVKDQKLHTAFRISICDIMRILQIFSMHDDAEDYLEFFNKKALGSTATLDNPIDSSALFYTFVENSFYVLSIGIDIAVDVPLEIAEPIGKILDTDYLFINYIHCVPQPNGVVKQYGYSKQQVAYLTQHAAEFNANDLTDKTIYKPSTPPIPKDETSIEATKLAIVKVIGRLPLHYIQFLYLHQQALAYIWLLFTACIDTFIPPTKDNPDRIFPQCPVPYQAQVTELIPAIQPLITILAASIKMEKQAQELIPPELAAVYQSVGLTTLANVVKKLIFGPYADPTYKIESNPNYIVEEEEQQQQQEEDDVCGDFEAFADNFDGVNDDNDNSRTSNNSNNNTSEEDTSRMSVGSFLRSLPAPSKSATRKLKQKSDQPMIPAGGLSEQLLDTEQNKSLKARILMMMLYSHNNDVGLLIQELMWNVAYESTEEYIRLCGFGRAIGLLANKGLPGFAAFAQNGLDLASLLDKKKK